MNMRILAALTTCLVAGTTASSAYAWEPLASCEPTWSTSPSQYHVNENGYSRIDLETVREIFADGFDEWERPCCSAWRATEAGLTTGTGEDNRNRQNIFSFRETTWPSNLGDGSFVLAVTLTTFQPDGRGGCSNLTADMVFNGVNHTYSTTGSGGTTDLLAVTVHEQGHWLGLDHTTVRGATMQATYFGTEGRSLHPDDEAGVCALYPQDCACSSDADCDPGEECISSVCVLPPCETNADCADGLECNTVTGDCIEPPCGSDADCSGNEVCISGECIREADCSICAACETADDCGGSAFICAGIPGRPSFCTAVCNSPADCPGDTECFQVPGENFAVCLNPESAQGNICPDDYICTEDGGGDLCENVVCDAGESCDPATGRCVGGGATGDCLVCASCSSDAECGGGVCASFDGTNGVCIISCDAGTDCPGENTECFQLQQQGGGTFNGCLNDNAATAGVCPSSFTCQEAVEPTDPCDGVVCDAGETCNPRTGDCVESGDTGNPDGGGTGGDDCVVCDSCGNDSDCGDGLCVNLGTGNVCVLDCTDSECPGNTSCFDVGDGAGGTISVCLNDTASTDGICPANYTCDPNAGDDGGGDPGVDGGGTDNGGTDGDIDGRGTGSDSCSAVPGSFAGLTPMLAALAMACAARRRRR